MGSRRRLRDWRRLLVLPRLVGASDARVRLDTRMAAGWGMGGVRHCVWWCQACLTPPLPGWYFLLSALALTAIEC